MTKQELVNVVNVINANWPQADADPKAQYEMWWRYLGDLDEENVSSVVDALVIEASQWRPRVGEIRRRAIDGDKSWPTPDGAWAIAEERRKCADMGVEAPALDSGVLSVLGEAMRGSRGQGKSGFMAEWQSALARRYGLPSPSLNT
jgi:hypothetical protein